MAAPRLRRIPPVVRRLLQAGFLLALVAALLVARQGTYRARFGAWALLAGFVLLAAILRHEEKELRRSPRRLMARLFGKGDPIAGRIEQALTVLEANDPGVSQALAELHFTRTLALVDRKQLDAVASRRAIRLGWAFWAVAGAASVCVVFRFFALVEGADVMLAREGVAPLELDYVENLDLRIRPPDYLRAEERQGHIASQEAAPKGSLLTLRGAPVQPGRAVFLTDGTSEVPFVDDGTGQIVARFPLSQDAELRVLARFGEVKIFDPVRIVVHAILDRAPEVTLEGAPRTVRLAAEDVSEIPIRYEAEDDHGLREVHLVLRSGSREERRNLARLDGTTRRDRGGHVLRLKDPFIARSYAPIEVVVEAKDNDPIDGPKWGKSPAITLVPPEVGEPEALRIGALRELRDRLVDTLASSLAPLAGDTAGKHKQARALADRIGEDDAALTTLLLSRFANLRIPSRVAVLLQAQNTKLRQASKSYLGGPSPTTRAAAATALERFVLVVDAVGQGRSLRDARQVARKLSEIADELTTAERMLESAGPESRLAAAGEAPSTSRPPEDVRGKALARAGAAKSLLTGGGRWLSELGVLGRDLGEIVGAYDKRVVRAEGTEDYFHAALAAADLAARLSEPDPSFQSQGGAGGGGFGGGEAGGSSGPPSEQGGEASEVEKAFQEAAAELGSLVEQHAEKVAQTERDAEGKADPEDLKEFQEEMKKHAEAIRKAAQPLPSVGGGSGSWTGKAAEAREQAEQMARALESGNVADAVQSGRSAKDAVSEAKQRGRSEADPSAQPKLDEAGKRFDEEIAFAEKVLKALKKKAQNRGAGELGKRAEDEADLAERMRGLGEKAGENDSLPDGALEALRAAERSARQAAESLRRGEGERGLAEQRDAQRGLERAKEALGHDDDDHDGEGEGEGDSKMPDGRADIPKADAHKGPDAFRQRVMRGLGEAQGKNRDAVQRYAEGLVR